MTNNSKSKSKSKSKSDNLLNTSNKNFLQEFLIRLEELKWVHQSSAQHYDRLNIGIITPSITITSISGIISFLSTSTLFDDTSKTAFGLTVGVLSSVSGLMQSFSSAFKFSTKAEMHRTAAEEYNKLIVRIKFEIADPNEPKFIEEIENKILEIQGNCKYFPPQSICDSYRSKKIDNI